ncbi:hypothetical protein [Hymenobacter sp. YC55]|uniref:hypothetical protein n=1 Tax=Hymenobacter sp. YC55 TaxID=3034019 RepID=UPI0023F80172|nr:hypothetical protein [Hymenobacter sp. YC55]MDF7815902.1 hypothetical protein [Hymenobacter sp. YC55]
MLPFAFLRVLPLFLLTLLATGCDHQAPEDVPQPTPPPTLPHAVKHHPVTVRYQVRSLGDSSQLPARSPELEVYYERVAPQPTGAIHLLGPSAQLHDQNLTTQPREVALPPISTYAGEVHPLITVTIAAEQASAAGYEVSCELIVDQQVATRTTFRAEAGQTTPWFVTRQVAVAH